MSPDDGGSLSTPGRTYINELGTDGYNALVKKVIASLANFKQLNTAEREDVASEAIIRAVSRAQFDPSDQPVAYIKTIARNLALKKIEELKKPKREVARVFMDHTDLDTLACTAVDAGEAEQEQELTDLAVEALGQVSPQQVYTQYHRALTKVRALPQISPLVREAYVRPSKDGE
ncbi:RNA polymerase sigma factor [Streptomyces anulatus]